MAGFLQTSFQSTTANNTASIISLVNSSSTPLGVSGIFTGQFENCENYGLIQINVSTDKNATLFVQQSYLGTPENIVASSQFEILGSDNIFFLGNTKYVYITYPFFRVELVNTSGVAQTALWLSSKMTSTPPASEGGAANPLNPIQDGVSVYGNDGAGPIALKTDATGQLFIANPGGGAGGDVVATNLVTQTLATRPLSEFYIQQDLNKWYRVASVGTGVNTYAIWSALGAIIGDETEPKIGRLFQYGKGTTTPIPSPWYEPGDIPGTIYDVEYSGNPNAIAAGTNSVLIAGKINGTDPNYNPNDVRYLQTTDTGILQVDIVSSSVPASDVSIKGSEGLTFKQTTSAQMVIVGPGDTNANLLATEITLGDIKVIQSDSKDILTTINTNTLNTATNVADGNDILTTINTNTLNTATSVADMYNLMLPTVMIANVAGNVTGTAFTALSDSFDLYVDGVQKFKTVCVMGIITDGVIIPPPAAPNKYLCLQYSNDGTTWYADGSYPTIQKLTAPAEETTFSFVLQRASVPTQYIRAFCLTSCNITNLTFNLISVN